MEPASEPAATQPEPAKAAAEAEAPKQEERVRAKPIPEPVSQQPFMLMDAPCHPDEPTNKEAPAAGLPRPKSKEEIVQEEEAASYVENLIEKAQVNAEDD